jgi:hypothetical protein
LLTDIFIMSLSGANALPYDLSKGLVQPPKGIKPVKTKVALVNALAQINGRMAKALEAHDHMENYPVRPELEASLSRLCYFALAAAQATNFDIVEETRSRWSAIEQRDPFASYLLNRAQRLS